MTEIIKHTPPTKRQLADAISRPKPEEDYGDNLGLAKVFTKAIEDHIQAGIFSIRDGWGEDSAELIKWVYSNRNLIESMGFDLWLQIDNIEMGYGMVDISFTDLLVVQLGHQVSKPERIPDLHNARYYSIKYNRLRRQKHRKDIRAYKSRVRPTREEAMTMINKRLMLSNNHAKPRAGTMSFSSYRDDQTGALGDLQMFDAIILLKSELKHSGYRVNHSAFRLFRLNRTYRGFGRVTVSWDILPNSHKEK